MKIEKYKSYFYRAIAILWTVSVLSVLKASVGPPPPPAATGGWYFHTAAGSSWGTVNVDSNYTDSKGVSWQTN